MDKAWQGKEVFVVSANDFLNCKKMEKYDLYYISYRQNAVTFFPFAIKDLLKNPFGNL